MNEKGEHYPEEKTEQKGFKYEVRFQDGTIKLCKTDEEVQEITRERGADVRDVINLEEKETE